MGAPDSGMQGVEQGTAESLLTAFRTIKADERARHAGVLDYWLSIRGNKEFPPLHDLDPLEISDAAPCSILLELISGGQDAEVRHLGDDLKSEIAVDRIIDAPNPSILACIAKKLPIVAISRDFLAFEDSYDTADGWTRCWVTLLPLSSCGSWVDYVYAFVSVEKKGGKAALPVETAPEAVLDEAGPAVETSEAQDPEAVAEELAAEEAIAEPVVDEAMVEEAAAEPEAEEPAVEEIVAEETVEPESAAEEIEAAEPVIEEAVTEEEVAEESAELVAEPELAEPEVIAEPELEETLQAVAEPDPEPEFEPEEPAEAPRAKSPGFAKLFEGFANLTGFYGQSVNIDPAVPLEEEGEELAEEAQADEEPAPQIVEPEAVEPEAIEQLGEPEEIAAEPVAIDEPAEEPVGDVAAEQSADGSVPQPAPALEGSLQTKLTEVRAKADEARQAALRATAALHDGLSAAYDFALDAETSPEEYLRLVEAQGLKIQLRAPMAPVVKLAFDGLADPATIKQLEAVLAWALKEELPRGALGTRIEEAGGITELLDGVSRPN